MKKITLLLLTILPFLSFGQTFNFTTDEEGWVAGNSASVSYDATSYYTSAGSLKLVTTASSKIAKFNSTLNSAGTYTVTFKIRGAADDGKVDKVSPKLNDGTNNVVGAEKFTDLTSSIGADGETWYEYSSSMDLIPSKNIQLQIAMINAGTYYLDDLTLAYTAPSGSVLTTSINGVGTIEYTPVQVDYAVTDVVTLTATPGTHMTLGSWSGDLSGSTNPETLTMDTSKSVTANFVVNPAFDFDFDFATDGDLENWTYANGLALTSHSAGVVTLTPGADTFSKFALDNFPIPAAVDDPAKYNIVSITIDNQSTNDDTLVVAITNDSEETESKSYTMDSGLKTYDINMTEFSAWNGNITSFKIRPIDADNESMSSGTGPIAISQVKFKYDATADLAKILESDFSMYPNPVKNILNIENSTPISRIDIYNLTGKLVYTSKTDSSKIHLNISSLKRGLYSVKITSENNHTTTQKLIKN